MNVHEEYYRKYKELLEKRFPFRFQNRRWVYVWQCIVVFGAAIIALCLMLRFKTFPKTYGVVAGWDVSLFACALNLVFAYGFGFVAVTNDWWFFFPDLDTGILWRIGKGQMVLGDVLFYALAVCMGHCAVIVTARMSVQARSARIDNLCKGLWFMAALAVVVFGLPFGSAVCKGMILWLYLPFGLLTLLFIRRYTAVQLWFPTGVFIVCEFLWDVVARVQGIWIFPDAATHPGLFFAEITLFNVGSYPVVWQPEMTQMAFMSGTICLVFFLVARSILRNEPVV